MSLTRSYWGGGEHDVTYVLNIIPFVYLRKKHPSGSLRESFSHCLLTNVPSYFCLLIPLHHGHLLIIGF